MDQESKCESQNYETLRRTRTFNLHVHGLGRGFLDMTLKV